MQVYLPIAEMTVDAEAILALGAVVGLLSGLFGVGGGFMTTPFLIFMGLPPAVAVGTQANQLVASSVSGVLGHWRKGNVDLKMGGVMLAGSVFGSVVGILIFRMLQHFGHIDLTIKLLYVVLLGSIGALMLVESVLTLMKKDEKKERQGIKQHRWIRNMPYKMRFPRSRLYISALLPAGIGFIGGLLVSVMGIGGGFLLVPAMIYILGMPTLLVAGTSLFQIIFSTALATVLHASLNHTVDLVLAMILIAGGVIGAQIGVRLARKIKGAVARVILAVLVLAVSIELLGELLIEPRDIYSTAVR